MSANPVMRRRNVRQWRPRTAPPPVAPKNYKITGNAESERWFTPYQIFEMCITALLILFFAVGMLYSDLAFAPIP